MIKKVLYVLTVVKTLVKTLALAIVLIFSSSQLPLAVMIASGVIIAAGVYLIIKRARGALRLADLAVYYSGDALQIVFNLVVVSFFSAMQVGFWEYLLIGTILDILIDIVLIILALRRGRYVDIRGVMDARNDRSAGDK